jgi:hypothetical protein
MLNKMHDAGQFQKKTQGISFRSRPPNLHDTRGNLRPVWQRSDSPEIGFVSNSSGGAAFRWSCSRFEKRLAKRFHLLH